MCNNSPSPEQPLLPLIQERNARERQEGNQTILTPASYPSRHQIVSIFTAESCAPGLAAVAPGSIRQVSILLAQLLLRASLGSQGAPLPAPPGPKTQ